MTPVAVSDTAHPTELEPSPRWIRVRAVWSEVLVPAAHPASYPHEGPVRSWTVRTGDRAEMEAPAKRVDSWRD
jgi:hypothetical protein